MQCSVQTQEATEANQQRKRMFGIEEQHFHIVQSIAAEELHSDLAMPLSTCSIQHPFQLQYLKSRMYFKEEQQPTTKHKSVSLGLDLALIARSMSSGFIQDWVLL